MLKKRIAIQALLVIMVVIVGAIFVQNKTILPRTYIEQISEADYLAAYQANELNPIRKDDYAQVIYSEKGTKLYKIRVLDKGYGEELPVDLEIFFATEMDGILIKDSYFAIAEMPATPKYANVFVLLDNFGIGSDEIYLNISISVVGFWDENGMPYNSIPYEYHSYGRFSLTTMETVEYKTK